MEYVLIFSLSFYEKTKTKQQTINPGWLGGKQRIHVWNSMSLTVKYGGGSVWLINVL